MRNKLSWPWGNLDWRRPMRGRVQGAFTLIELLLPSLNQAKDMAKQIYCLNTLKQNHVGFAMYTDDAEGWWPPYMDYNCQNLVQAPYDWIYQVYSGNSYRKQFLCAGTKVTAGSSFYQPVRINEFQISTSYSIFCGTANYPDPTSTVYFYGWGSAGWGSTKSAPAAPSPRTNFLGRTVKDPQSGKSMYVAEAAVLPIMLDINHPRYPVLEYGPTAIKYANNHRTGQNVVYADGHGKFLRNGEIKQRYKSVYW